MGIVFEWDEAKAESNRRKHGVTFSEAATVFGDQLMITRPDTRDALDEDRSFSVGESLRGRLLAVSHLEAASVIRIISARKATASERKSYEGKQ